MLITNVSLISGVKHTLDIPITQDQMNDWVNSGESAMVAFPHLTPDQWEFLNTGITREEWEEIFKDEEQP